MSSYISDVGSIIGAAGGLPELKNSTSRKPNANELDMTDFLNLMVVQLQNQTIDNTMDTSDMLNQMVQMQMITALTNMTDASVMSYASSLVGKEVTIGDYSSGELEEKVVTITGSGLSNGKQVLFAGDEVYNLSSVMAVGRLPNRDKGDGEEDEDVKTEAAGEGNKTETAVEGNKTDKTEAAGQDNKTNGADPDQPVAGTDASGTAAQFGQSSVDSASLEEKEMETVKNFLNSLNISFPSDVTIDELNEMLDDYFESIRGAGEASSQQGGDPNAQALQAARELLKANRVNMAEDSTDEEILMEAERILKAGRIETAQDTSAEQQPEGGKDVDGVAGRGGSGGAEDKNEAAGQDSRDSVSAPGEKMPGQDEQ